MTAKVGVLGKNAPEGRQPKIWRKHEDFGFDHGRQILGSQSVKLIKAEVFLVISDTKVSECSAVY